MAISFFSPFYLLLLLPAAALLLLYNGRRRYPQAVRLPALLMRALIFLLIIAALAKPHLVKIYRGLSVIFLVDRSLSVEAAGDPTGWINESLSHRRHGDQAAIVFFGGDSQLVKPFAMERLSGAAAAAIEREHTDIESALRVAAGLIPADSNGRIVLVSDGLETGGDSRALAEMLRAGRIPVDVLPVSVEEGDEVALLDVFLPRNLHPGRQAAVEVEVQSTVHTAGKLSLLWGGHPVFQGEVSFSKGRQRFSIPVEAAGQGPVKVQAIIEPARDTWARNNSMAGLTFVEAPPRVLVVEGGEDRGLPLHDLLLLGGVEAQRVPPGRLPSSPAALAEYRAVFLVDVPAYDLSAAQQQNLEHFVRVLGGGLIAVGGKHAYGMGLYQDTPLEKVLPVSMEVESEEELPGLDLVLVIDKSGSMSGDKLNMAKNAAVVSLDILKERDRLAVITFDDSYHVELPLTEVQDKDRLAGIIEDIGVGGGTSIYPALAEAVRLLAGGKRTKHIVLLSDGMEGGGGYEYSRLLEEMAGGNITLSTIALGADADRVHMQNLAEKGSGRYYYVPEYADLPAVFLQETVLAGGDYLVEEDFIPAVVHPDASSLGTAPPLFNGYVASTAKPTAEVLLVTHREHPLLARWQYGLGRAAAFTSDSWGMWSGEFLNHPAFAGFWLDLLAWAVPGTGEGEIALEARLEGAGVEITALVAEPLEEGEKLLVTITDETLQQHELELKPVGGGRYTARLERVNQGVYLLSARRLQGAAVTGSTVSGFTVPYPAEFRPAVPGAGESLLREISDLSGGCVLRSPREVFRPPHEPVRRSTDISQWLLLAAVLLWPLDIALRRFSLAPALPAVRVRPRRRPKEDDLSPARAAMERLLAAKKKRN